MRKQKYKKDTLHTVTPYNRAAFMPDEDVNLFDGVTGSSYLDRADRYFGGNSLRDTVENIAWLKSYNPTSGPMVTRPMATAISPMVNTSIDTGRLKGLTQNINTPSKFGLQVKDFVNNYGNDVASVASPFITKALSNGYSTGVGNGISTVGNAVGDAIGGPYGALVKVGSAALGGIYNAGMGVKLNEDFINNIKDNASQMESAGNALASANTNASVLDASKMMGSTMNFDYHDLGSTGFLRTNNRLKREEKRLNDTQNLALAKQSHGLMLGANQADRTLDDLANSTFIAAYGGQLYNGDNNMDATNYDLAMNYLLTKQKEANAKDKMTTMNFNYFSEQPNEFASGGKIHIKKKNRGKFNATKKRTGKTTEELTHSKNPLTRKRAIFALNSRKWSHKKDLGGYLEGGVYDLPEEEIQQLINEGYEIEYL